jgi:alpha-galactosidase
MKQVVKITLIGAGSPTFTPFLFKRILKGTLHRENEVEVALMDVDENALSLMQVILSKILDSCQGHANDPRIKVTKQSNLSKALKDADFVVTTFGVGGLEATQLDVDIPRKFGIFQSIGTQLDLVVSLGACAISQLFWILRGPWKIFALRRFSLTILIR